MADKYREVKYTSGASCNKEITREKSVKKKVRCERTRELKIGRGKVKPIRRSLD